MTTTNPTKPHASRLKEPLPLVSLEAASQSFLESVAKPKEGQNGYLREFVALMAHVAQHYGSFSVHDVITRANGLDIPPMETVRLFNLWTAKMDELGKLVVIPGVYDEPVFLFL